MIFKFKEPITQDLHNGFFEYPLSKRIKTTNYYFTLASYLEFAIASITRAVPTTIKTGAAT